MSEFFALLIRLLAALASNRVWFIRLQGAIRASNMSGTREAGDVELRFTRVGPKGGVYATFAGLQGLPGGEFGISWKQITALCIGARIGIRVDVAGRRPIVFLQRDNAGAMLVETVAHTGRSFRAWKYPVPIVR